MRAICVMAMAATAAASLEPSSSFPGDKQYWEGTMFEIDLPKASIAGMLPIGLEPAAVPGSKDNSTHPLTWQICTQYHVGSPFTNFNYKELTVTIPYVQWDDQHSHKWKYYRGPFGYDIKLYLNRTIPVLLGRKYVGDNKEFAYIGETLEKDGSGTFSIIGTDWGPFKGEVIIEATWKTHGPYKNAKSAFPQLGSDPIPSIGHYPPNNDSAPWECLPSTDYSDVALATPASGTLMVHKSFQVGVPVGEYKMKALGPDGSGAFRMKSKWGYENIPLQFYKTGCYDYSPADWPLSRREPSAIGKHAVASEYFYVGGFIAGGNQDAYLVYPTDGEGPFPVVSFAHGCCKKTANDTEQDYDSLLRAVASHGVVVASFNTCLEACRKEHYSADQLHLISALKKNPSLHPVLSKADFSRVALMGHSMGGGSTIMGAASGIEGIVAAVAIHPGPEDASKGKVPTFFMCGSIDPVVPCPEVKAMYNQTPPALQGKNVFADLKNAFHTEIQKAGTNNWNFYVVQFMLCHLNRDDTACANIYGSGPDALCTAGFMEECEHGASRNEEQLLV